MLLTNPTDEALNVAFADVVCGEKIEHGEYYHDHPPSGRCMTGGSGPGITHPNEGLGGGFYLPLSYCASADLVLPWLEKCYVETDWVSGPVRHYTEATGPRCWRIRIPGRAEEVEDASFSRGCVLALLKAHGVTIEFTK